jgi:hypothetical protein
MAIIQKSQNNNKFCVFFKGLQYVCGLTLEEAEDLIHHLDSEFEASTDVLDTLQDQIAIFPSVRTAFPLEPLENFGQNSEIIGKYTQQKTPMHCYEAAIA